MSTTLEPAAKYDGRDDGCHLQFGSLEGRSCWPTPHCVKKPAAL
eukprot:CAMPEP_0115370820 /NCGR_PEP_ID=MMETSP0271-20121206/38_1 /TAXON_ID=71861 /ORGANISM="Scrippsiella trochoidea, Strain CCMP3099" /LENGTH=43 /DNA_ID= /DNA_START= /DNA_END= /DNA_ORIENTATION=